MIDNLMQSICNFSIFYVVILALFQFLAIFALIYLIVHFVRKNKKAKEIISLCQKTFIKLACDIDDIMNK